MATSIVFLIIGLVLLVVSLNTLFHFRRISKIGTPTEGIIFDTENSTNVDTRCNYPIVRFNTSSNEWITQTYKTGLFPGFYKKGAKVKIIYDPNKPTDFFIKASHTFYIPLLLALLSIPLLAWGILNLISLPGFFPG